MIAVLSREQMRAFDADATASQHVPASVLMDHAGTGAAKLLASLAPQPLALVLVVCGTGNNGGDGLVVARELLTQTMTARVVIIGKPESFSAEARVHYEAFLELGGNVTCVEPEAAPSALAAWLQVAEVIVDALFGIGLNRVLTAPWVAIIEQINQAPGLRIALDIPSGLDANTGAVMGAAVMAHHTITFAAPKLGLMTTAGVEHAGKLHIASIGVPAPDPVGPAVSARALEHADVGRCLGPRKLSLHKGSIGRVAVVAGSPGKIGAALLCARGALRSGAALVTLVGLPETTRVFAQRVTEEMTTALSEADLEGSMRQAFAGMDVVVVGPGLGLDESARRIVAVVLAEFAGKVVVDADALTHFAGRAEEFRRASGELVLTPHPGEMARLLGTTTAMVESDRFAAVRRAVELTGQVVLLKGPRTIIGAPGQAPYVNTVGAPVLAVGGSGDVLSGVVAALLLSLPPFEAAACAAFLHGASGVRWTASQGADRGMLAREIADGVVGALAELSERT